MEQVILLAGKRQKRESSRARQACNDYLRMGPGRSLRDLWRRYTSSNTDTQIEPPTRAYTTLRNWSSRYNWSERAEAYDAQLEAEKTARAQEIMQTGLAFTHERVKELKELYALLKKQLYDRGEDGTLHKLWVPDVKQVGSGSHAERVDIERYNSPLIGDIRGVLNDLAEETGGRQKRLEHEHIGKAGGPIEFIEVSSEDRGE